MLAFLKSIDWSAACAKFIAMIAPVVHSVAAVAVADPAITNPYIKAVALGVSGAQMAESYIANAHLVNVAVNEATTVPTPVATPLRA